jgi:ornithine cyclodeaminase/alanine dehydrogenase-like protein (mu-crystallin family)
VLSFAGRNSFVDTFSTTAATLSTHQPVITPLKMSSSTDNQISSLPSSSSTTTAATTTTVGFLGCGTIASAIATGLLTQKDPRHVIDKVYVTKRSEAKSSALTNQFQDKVVVTEYMQEIVNCSDLVFLCVLPEQVETVLKDLNFDTKSHQTLISLVVSMHRAATKQYTMVGMQWGAVCLCDAFTFSPIICMYCTHFSQLFTFY